MTLIETMKRVFLMRARTRAVLSLLGVSVLAAGCSSVPTRDITIDTAADPTINFGGYSTYAWLGSALIVHDEEGRWSPAPLDANTHVRYLINEQLNKRNIMLDESAPDLIIYYGAGVDMDKLEFKTDDETKNLTLQNVPSGGLLITFLDRRTGLVVWAAAASGEVQQNADADTVKKRLEYAVKKMFAELPQ